MPAGWRFARNALTAAGAISVTGCGGLQSALDPIGPSAREIAVLWWAMAAGATIVFALVLGFLLYALYGGSGRRRIKPMQLILVGGIVVPVVVLSILVPFNINVASGVTAEAEPGTLTIRVHARQWWWEIEYDDGTPGGSFTTANELYLPVGEPVELLLTSADVIHSLWLPRLAGKLDLIPGRTNRLLVEADTAGVLRGQCAEFCGVGHTRMALYAVAVPPGRYREWAERQRTPAAEPSDELARDGARLFATNGCALCHAVRGHDAWGRLGPDLTHVGGRMTIGAGLLDTTPQNLALWIARNDAVKPGNLMPDYADLDPPTRDAIAAYLDGLE